jgi:IS5 family transposase
LRDMRTVHYVGMDEATYERARRVFGGPAYYHRWNDRRVETEVGSEDTVVYGDSTYREWVWDASAVPSCYTD